MIEPLYEGSFSDSSFGFRPGRSQHQAVQHALKHIADGHPWVVDVDLKSFLYFLAHSFSGLGFDHRTFGLGGFAGLRPFSVS